MGRSFGFDCAIKLSDRINQISEKFALMETLRKKFTRIPYPENKVYQMLSFVLGAYLSQRISAPRGRPDMTAMIKFTSHLIKKPS